MDGPATIGARATASRRPAAGFGAALLAGLLAACSGGGGSGSSSPTPLLLTHRAAYYLLTLDQLRVAEFTVAEGPHTLGIDAAGAGDAQLSIALRAAAMQDAATVRYFRPVSDLGTADGFLDVRSTVLRFGSAGNAHRAFLAEVRHTDSVPLITPESTDALGDEAHADQLTVNGPGGAQLVELTVAMRDANLVELIVVRGRLGGTSLSDALVLAHRELASQ